MCHGGKERITPMMGMPKHHFLSINSVSITLQSLHKSCWHAETGPILVLVSHPRKPRSRKVRRGALDPTDSEQAGTTCSSQASLQSSEEPLAVPCIHPSPLPGLFFPLSLAFVVGQSTGSTGPFHRGKQASLD